MVPSVSERGLKLLCEPGREDLQPRGGEMDRVQIHRFSTRRRSDTYPLRAELPVQVSDRDVLVR